MQFQVVKNSYNVTNGVKVQFTSGSDSSDSKKCNDLFPAAAENAARNCALIDDPIEDEPEKYNRPETIK